MLRRGKQAARDARKDKEMDYKPLSGFSFASFAALASHRRQVTSGREAGFQRLGARAGVSHARSSASVARARGGRRENRKEGLTLLVHPVNAYLDPKRFKATQFDPFRPSCGGLAVDLFYLISIGHGFRSLPENDKIDGKG